MSTGEYSPGHVPMVFVETTPPPGPPKSSNNNEGGVVISRGLILAIALVIIGVLIGASYFFYKQAQDADAAREKEVAGRVEDQKKFDEAYGKLRDDFEKLRGESQALQDRVDAYGDVDKLRGQTQSARARIKTLLAEPKRANMPNKPTDAAMADPPWQASVSDVLRERLKTLAAIETRVAAYPPILAPPKPGPGIVNEPAPAPAPAPN